jgi:asparagine synthase (glutamine-hydrolysing)
LYGSNARHSVIRENSAITEGVSLLCGIVGYLNLNGRPLDRDERFIDPMCTSINHRGPDDSGTMIMGPVALGMTRLSIIDLKTGHQPIGNEDGSVWIVFNGEIYNYKELQKQLIARGHRLATGSDTETIVHLYEEYGVECLKFLEGMFAFALWDHERQRLFIARDRMGEKPLHWAVFENQLIFASEIKGILAHPRARKQLNPESLQKYLALEYVPAPHSIFKDIDKLMPAHYMLVEQGQVKIRNYWQPDTFTKPIAEGEAREKLTHLLDESIKGRLISDVPLGVFLSGGIDSSAIAALSAKNLNRQLDTFSIGFADPSFDETDAAASVAAHLGTNHHVAQFDPSTALNTVEELWEVLDEPLADASIIPTFFLSKMTREKVTVALAGEGGDELFGGYPTYQAHRLAKYWGMLPAALRHGILEPAIRNLPVSMNNLSFDYKAKRFISAVEAPPVKRHLRWMGSIPITDHAQLIQPEVLCLSGDEQLYPGLGSGEGGLLGVRISAGPDVVSTIMHLDMTTYLPDDLLVKSDRASMAAALEVRLPFLAYPLVEFALSLPTSLKVKGLTTKYLLKKAMSKYLPERTLQRPKKGFGIPVAKWLRNEFQPVVMELLGEDFVRKQDIFRWHYVRQLLQEHRDGRVDRRKELWTLLMFQMWWRKYFASGS